MVAVAVGVAVVVAVGVAVVVVVAVAVGVVVAVAVGVAVVVGVGVVVVVAVVVGVVAVGVAVGVGVVKQPRKRTPPRAQLAAERVAHEETRRERDAYKKAKAENDERFMTERDEARALADAERQARERAEAALSRARELLRENRAAFAICQIPAATMEVDGFDGGPWDMCPHCGAVAEECDKLADCWGAKTRAYLAAPAASRSPDGEPCRACGWSFHPMCCNASEHPDANPTTSKE